MSARYGPKGDVRWRAAEEFPCPRRFERWIKRQIRNRSVHEDDFLILDRFPRAELLIIDAGSNIGNSAISCEVMVPNCRIIGFEPMPSLTPLLELTRQFCGGFSYFSFGLSDHQTVAPLYIPIAGGRYIFGESSMDLEHFSEPTVSDRLRSYSWTRRFALEACELPFCRLDDVMEVRQACEVARTILFKIDVEGAECSVLRGAGDILRQHHPVLLVENGEREAVRTLTDQFGYRRYIRTDDNKLVPADQHNAVNSFFALPATIAALRLDRA